MHISPPVRIGVHFEPHLVRQVHVTDTAMAQWVWQWPSPAMASCTCTPVKHTNDCHVIELTGLVIPEKKQHARTRAQQIGSMFIWCVADWLASLRHMHWFMYVCIYIYIYLCMYVCIYVCMYVCMNVFMYCMNVHTYVRMYVCMYVCVYVCICMYVHTMYV